MVFTLPQILCDNHLIDGILNRNTLVSYNHDPPPEVGWTDRWTEGGRKERGTEEGKEEGREGEKKEGNL